MFFDRRIIWSDNGVIKDITNSVTGPLATGLIMDVKAATDKIYVGSILPFNHLFFDFQTVNNEASTITAEFWDGTQWVSMVDVVDETNGWFNHGKITWTVPRETSWVRELDSFDVSGLETTVIYNFYWLRLSFSADIKNTTHPKFVGHRYSSDSDLFTFYPDLQQTALMEQYETGKVDWNTQCLMATEACLAYLKAKDIIKADSSILRPDILKVAAVHKTAEIIYAAFGEAYKNDKIEAKKSFEDAINLKFFQTDVDSNGRLTDIDRTISTGRLTR